MISAKLYSGKYLQSEIREIELSGRKDELSQLSLEEKAIIFKYSNDGYESLNESIRKTGGQITTEFGLLLNSTLSKLPNYADLVFRKVQLTALQLKYYESALLEDKEIIEPAFISTSKSRMIAMEYPGNALFVIFSKTGKEIEKIAKFGKFNAQNEKEVLFSPQARFSVLEFAKENDYMLITMEEL